MLGWLLLAVAVLGAGGLGLLWAEKRPEASPVGRGEHLAQQAGCFACHGRGDGETRFNLRQANDKWTGKNNPTFWDNGITEAKVLKDWIANGVPADQAERHKRLFVQMPAYKDRLTAEEIDAIAAWILAEGLKYTQAAAIKDKPVAVPDPRPTGDALFIVGDHLARKYGCYQCHGELGQGSVSNPDSFKGYIPGFFGKDFRLLTADGDRSELLHWIDTGHGNAIESGPLAPLAKKYIDGQATKMPGYRDRLSAAEKQVLVDFMVMLNAKGPLPAAEIERVVTLVDAETSN